MASDRFKKYQAVTVSHLQADSRRVEFSGEIVDHVRDDVWLVNVPAMGLLLTLEEKDIRDGE